jgi:hypothetical protein
MKKLDLTGQKFGRLTVKEEAGKNENGDILWECTCECGNIKFISRNCLRSGHTKSCGRLVSEIAKNNAVKRNTTHGLYGIPAHKSWTHMILRCTNPNYNRFIDYGGRGIKVCKRWRLFENFYADMGDRPEGKTIERKNNDLGYYKENCRWASRSEQQHNCRISKNNTTGCPGVYFNKKAQNYYAQICLNNKKYYLGCFNTIKEAAEARKQGELKYWGSNV